MNQPAGGDAGGWFQEKLFPHVRQTFEITRILFRERTEHQDLVIFETPTYGRVLALDDVIQVTEKDEFVYHEMMTHVPILAHGKARKVLIIGGGDGGILREALRHKSVQQGDHGRDRPRRCRHVPRNTCRRSRRRPSTTSAPTSSSPTARKFVAETAERYDVVIVDSTDPMGPGEVLFTEAFYRNCRRCMTPGGVMVNQNGVPFMQPDEVTMTYRRRKKSFKVSSFYIAAVPSYYGGFMTLGWASNDTKLHQTRLATIAKRAKAAKLKTKYYSPEVHVGAFALPQFVHSHIK